MLTDSPQSISKENQGLFNLTRKDDILPKMLENVVNELSKVIKVKV